MLRLTPLLALAGAATDSATEREDITVSNALRQIFGGVGEVKRLNDPQPMKIINIGLARTATSSFVTAMRELGIKSYHMKDGVQDSEGHADLWIAHAALALEAESNKVKTGWRTDEAVVASRAALFEQIAADGFNATADMPMIAYYKELIELYPAALVVMTEHPTGSAERWAASVKATIGRNEELFQQPPFTFISMMRGFLRMEMWNWQAQGAPPRRTSPGAPPAFDTAELVAFYRKWNSEAEEWVKSKQRRLLKFKATDGWKPLCDFVAALNDASVDAKCAAIVASGVPYPSANVDLRKVYAVLGGLVAFFQLPLSVIAAIAVAALALGVRLCSACCRRRRPARSNDKKGKAA